MDHKDIQTDEIQPLKEETGGGGQPSPGRTNQRWIEASSGREQRAVSAVSTLVEDSEVTAGRTEPREGILVVDVVPRVNRRVVMCRVVRGDEVGELVTVRVRDNGNYLRGMEVEGAYEEGPGMWVRPGRGPRRRGVW